MFEYKNKDKDLYVKAKQIKNANDMNDVNLFLKSIRSDISASAYMSGVDDVFVIDKKGDKSIFVNKGDYIVVVDKDNVFVANEHTFNRLFI